MAILFFGKFNAKFLVVPWIFACVLSVAAFTQSAAHLPQNASIQNSGLVSPGVVVESVMRNSEAEKAGIQEGDVIVGWSQGSAHGPIDSPFDLRWTEMFQAPKGAVRLVGLVKNQRKTWDLGPDRWGIQSRPNFGSALMALYDQEYKLLLDKKIDEIAEMWRKAAMGSPTVKPPWLRAWLLGRCAATFAAGKKWQQADKVFGQLAADKEFSDAVRAEMFFSWAESFSARHDWTAADEKYAQALSLRRQAAGDDPEASILLAKRGDMARRLGDLTKAEHYYQHALAIRLKLAPDGLDLAAVYDDLGEVARARSDLSKAVEYYLEALAIKQKLMPGTLRSAQQLTVLGFMFASQGELTKANDYYQQALATQEKLAPEGLGAAWTFNSLGLLQIEYGDLDKAEQYFQKALAIREKLIPRSLPFAGSLKCLGIVAFDRGDLAKSEEYERRALAIVEKRGSDPAAVAGSLHNLGVTAMARGDLASSERYLRRALATTERIAPGSNLHAHILTGLGMIAQKRGNLVEAEKYLRDSLAMEEKLAPGSMEVARSLQNLGAVMQLRGDLDKAEKLLNQALSIEQKTAPNGLDISWPLMALGKVAEKKADIQDAEDYYRRALSIREKLVPGSLEHAESLAAMAGIQRKKGQLDAAAGYYEKALKALESHTSQLGGNNEERAEFRSKHRNYYTDYIDLLMLRNQPQAALDVLERSRARTLAEMLENSHVELRRGGDPALISRERSLRGDITIKSNRRIQLLGGKHSAEQIHEIDKQINDVIAKYQDVEAQIRATSPTYAALTQPHPLTAKQIQQQLLDQDTLLLEYSLGEKRSYVFAVTPDSLHAYQLPGRAAIERQALNVHRLVTAQRTAVRGESPTARRHRMARAEIRYDRAVAALSRMILGPVRKELANKRLLVVTDGALAYVPFSLLPEPRVSVTRSRDAGPLIVHHEIVNLPSASVLAILRQQEIRRKPAPRAVAVLADPVFDKHDPRVTEAAASVRPAPATQTRSAKQDALDGLLGGDLSADLLKRSATDLGLTRDGHMALPRLRFTRLEADAIMRATPHGKGLEAVDFKANRATATSPELSHYRIVHFATHGLLNSEHPELSGLVLSLVDKKGKPENGFLSLEDIYNLNLPADLVVLSACETALGKEVRGEGLIGLTRGFMYAGASRVVASLWNVSDVATAQLMANFYRAMEKHGLAPAAALRAAQIAMWKQKRWHSPYYWAAFQIQGEWK